MVGRAHVLGGQPRQVLLHADQDWLESLGQTEREAVDLSLVGPR